MMESTNQSRTLWLGDLQAFMDQTYLSNLSITLGYSQHLTSVKIIKDKITGLPSKYGFLEFSSHKFAQKFMLQFNNKPMPNSVNKYFKIKWASYGGGVKPSNISSTTTSNEISVYVGDLQSSVNEAKLLQFFKSKYPSAFSSKIITEPSTKLSKGYGFVKFVNPEEAQRAISEMNGINLNGKSIKVSHAYMKNKEEVKEEQPNDETEAAQRIKIYQQYYSTLNDPVIKADYEKQMQKMFGKNFSAKKNDFKNSLQGVKTLSYAQTKSSQKFLETQPKMISYNSKRDIERRFLN